MTGQRLQQRIGLGGGCYWCTEAVFQNLRGVTDVTQGYIFSQPPHDSLSEAVLVDFDPNQISLADLVEIHVRTHASTSQHSMRKKYRSAVYVMDARQAQDAEDILTGLQADFGSELVTLVLPFSGFERSDEKYHDYYANHRDNLFCQRYIDPKLETLRREYAHLSLDKHQAG